MMEFRTLGPLEVVDDGRVVAIEGGVRRRLLCVLLASAGRPVPYASLVRAGWADEPPPTARRVVQSHVSRLRALALEIERAGDGYQLLVEPSSVDAHRFRMFCEERAFEDASVRELQAALASWRGDAWSDLAEVVPLREHAELQEYREAVEERIVLLELRSGEHERAAAEAEGLTRARPRREVGWALWAVAMYARQRRSDALDVLQRARTAIAEAGLDPGPLLQEIESLLLDDAPVALAIDALNTAPADPPPSRTDAHPAGGRLPVALAPLVGRQEQLALLADLLATRRLVTLTGAGGVGKTRLAVAAIRDIAGRRTDAAWFCELAPLVDDHSVAHAFAATLGVVSSNGESAAAAARFLRDKRALVVIDNCEHVVKGVVELVEHLLSVAPDAVVLATSREPLGIDGEHLVHVPPLDVGDDLALFVDRVARVTGAYTPDAEELGHIRALCDVLGGLPLAIELAAARVRSITPAELREQLEASNAVLADRGRRLERHRTMDAALGWSYGLLDEAERQALPQLSVFSGGFTLADAAAVVDIDQDTGPELVDVIDTLVQKSLVEVAERRASSRYRILEPIRQHALRKLDEHGGEAMVRDRHADHFTEQVRRDALSPESYLDMENLRSALRWLAHTRRTGQALELVHSLRGRALAQLLHEVGDWCEQVIDLPGAAAHPLGPQVCGLAAHFAYFQGRLDRTWELVERAEAMPAFSRHTLHPTYVRAAVLHQKGDTPEVHALLDGIDDSDPIAFVTVNWQRVSWANDPLRDEHAIEAFDHLAKAAPLHPALRKRYLSAAVLRASLSGDRAATDAALEELWSALEDGDEWDRANAVLRRVGVAMRDQTLDAALLDDVLTTFETSKRCGQHIDRWFLLRSASHILWVTGNRDGAALLRAAFEASPWDVPGPAKRFEKDRLLAGLLPLARCRLEDARNLSLDDLTRLAVDAISEAKNTMAQHALG